MNKLIEKHQKSIEILENIEQYYLRLELETKHISLFQDDFPELTEKSKHNIEIYKKCIERLKERYVKLQKI